ncbi:ABC transporter substrate-binding protein [Monashia sp. NPDC004114]
MRIKAITVVAVAGALALAACSGRSSGGSESGGGATTINWWMVTQNDTATAKLKQTISDFEKKNPDIKVNVTYKAVDPLKDALRTSAGTSAGPDLYYMWAGPGLGGEFVKNNVSLDLTTYYQQYGWKDRFTPATLTNYSQYGGYHGVPWTQRGEVVYYNKALFQKAGITDPPTTFDEMLADAQKLKAAGITPITFGGKDNWHVMRLLDSLIEANCGADKGDQLNHRETSWANEPCVTKSFTDLKNWAQYFQTGWVSAAQGDAANLFFAGKSAMQIEGDWFTQNIVDNGGKIADVSTFMIPTGTGRLYGFSEGMYVTKASKHPDQAAKFADYLTSSDVQSSFGSAFAALSVNKEVKPNSDQPIDKDFQNYFGQAKGYFLNNDQNFPTNVTTEYWRIQNGVAQGTIDPASAGAEFQKFIDANK